MQEQQIIERIKSVKAEYAHLDCTPQSVNYGILNGRFLQVSRGLKRLEIVDIGLDINNNDLVKFVMSHILPPSFEPAFKEEIKDGIVHTTKFYPNGWIERYSYSLEEEE